MVTEFEIQGVNGEVPQVMWAERDCHKGAAAILLLSSSSPEMEPTTSSLAGGFHPSIPCFLIHGLPLINLFQESAPAGRPGSRAAGRRLSALGEVPSTDV